MESNKKCLLEKGQKTPPNHQFLGFLVNFFFGGVYNFCWFAVQQQLCFSCLEVVLQDSSIPMELQVFFGWGVVGDDVYVHYIQIETN